MVYNSRKGILFPAVMILLGAFMIGFFISGPWQLAMIFLAVELLFLWFLLDTYYIIRNGELYYKSAFISGSLSINIIHDIELHTKGMHACSLKPALDIKGLIIKYNRYDDIFISPERQDEFIAQLLAINPGIKVN